MKWKRYYGYIILVYILVILYVIFVNEVIVATVLLLGLMIFHVVSISNITENLFQEKEDSVIVLQHELDKTKKETKETYRQFLSLSTIVGSGVMLINYEGTIDFSNKDVSLYFNQDFNNLDYQVLHNIKPLYQFVNEAFLLEDTTRKQITYNEKHYDCISTPIFEDEMFQGCLIIIHDITLLKTAEQFQKQFSADISHELKTPLSAIKGISEILNRDTKMPEKERQEFIDLVHKEIIRMEHILRDLLIISKLDRLDYDLHKEETDIKDIILDSINTLEHHFEKKQIAIQHDITSLHLYIDPVKIGQVVSNLIKNALNYTDEGYVKVRGSKNKNQYVIEVEDSGIGIPKSERENIFKRFYRIDAARSRNTGGSGLGLSIVKNVVLKHNGTIKVHEGNQQGTIFTVTLPIQNKE